MTGKLHHYSGILALAAAFGLAACEGDTGPQGPAGLGFTPPPTPDQTLGNYDPAGDPVDQELVNLLDSGTGVWEIALDGEGVQLDFGDGAPPLVGETVRYDADHNELWIQVDGEWIPLTDESFGFQSHGCTTGVAKACITVTELSNGDYAVLAEAFIEHDPATDTRGLAHYGLKTATADVPTVGTATYNVNNLSAYEVEYNGALFNDYSGTPTITADFDAGEVTYSDTVVDGVTVLSVDATAIIDGNSYTALSVTGSFDPDNTVVDDGTTFDTGTLSGTFYGPDALETAGTIDASDTDAVADADGSTATSHVIGGFFGAQ